MLLVVGEIARPHGVRGEVVVTVRTDEPSERFTPGVVLLTAPPEAGPLTIESVRPHLGRLIVAFEGVEDRDGAEALRRVLVCVDSSSVPPLDDPDEFHDHQLVGLAAVDPDGEKIGEVVRIDHGPAHDMLILRRPDGRTALVPFVGAMVPEVDLAGGRLVMTLPEGLLDL
jgi:16S rRNA processing protein RimM